MSSWNPRKKPLQLREHKLHYEALIRAVAWMRLQGTPWPTIARTLGVAESTAKRWGYMEVHNMPRPPPITDSPSEWGMSIIREAIPESSGSR